MSDDNRVKQQVGIGMDRIEEFGNTSEETRAAAIQATAILALAMAFDKLADKLGVQVIPPAANPLAGPYRPVNTIVDDNTKDTRML